MSKVRVIVSVDVECKAKFAVDIEDEVAGVYESAETRATNLVFAMISAGHPVAWEYEHEPLPVKARHYFEAERDPAFDEVVFPPPQKPQDATATTAALQTIIGAFHIGNPVTKTKGD